MIDTEFLHLLDKFSLVLNKRVTSNYRGERQSKVVGSGLIFRDYSPYMYGDDFRAIDWRQYAKTRKLYVKRYEEDRNLTVHVVLDYSASMQFGKPLKCVYAAQVALGFIYMALKNNENFVLATFSDSLEVFRPRKGRKQLVALLDYLNQKKPIGKSQLAESLLSYGSIVQSKSLLIIISDFLYDADQIRTVLHRYKDNKIICVQVLDTTELHLSLEGDFTLVDLEDKTSVKTFVDPYVRQQYLDALHHHSSLVKEACDKVDAEFYQVNTSTPIFDTFFEILT